MPCFQRHRDDVNSTTSSTHLFHEFDNGAFKYEEHSVSTSYNTFPNIHYLQPDSPTQSPKVCYNGDRQAKQLHSPVSYRGAALHASSTDAHQKELKIETNGKVYISPSWNQVTYM